MSETRTNDNSDPKPSAEAPKNILPDLIIPVMSAAFAIYYLTTITSVPWIAQASAVLVSVLLFLAILAFVIRTFLRMRAGIETIQFGGFSFDHSNDLKRAGLLALAIAYVWFIEDLGFTISTVIFLFLAIILLSTIGNWKNAAAVAISCSLIGYFIFIFIFETRFPEGPVEKLMAPYAKSVRQVFDGN